MSKKNGTLGEIIVGLFMIAVIGLMGYFTIVISGVDIIRGENKMTIRVVFDQVGGLKDHDNVMYRGTKVGKVESVEVTPTNLVVVASVNRNVTLRESARLAVCNLSMLGGNYLLLEEGEGEALDLETTLFAGETPSDWMQDVTAIAKQVREITDLEEFKKIVKNIENASAKADRFMDDLEVVGGDAKTFMTKANAVADKIDATIVDARAFIAKASTTLETVDSAAASVGSAADSVGTMATTATTTATTITSAAAKADDILAKLDNDQTFADLEAGVAAFRKSAESFDATELMAKANTLADNLNEITRKLREGEGTLGKLTNDPKLYDELMGLLKDARQVLDNYRDTTPISTFSSLATGAL